MGIIKLLRNSKSRSPLILRILSQERLLQRKNEIIQYYFDFFCYNQRSSRLSCPRVSFLIIETISIFRANHMIWSRYGPYRNLVLSLVYFGLYFWNGGLKTFKWLRTRLLGCIFCRQTTVWCIVWRKWQSNAWKMPQRSWIWQTSMQCHQLRLSLWRLLIHVP